MMMTMMMSIAPVDIFLVFGLVFLIFYAFLKLTVLPLIRYGPLLRKVGVAVPGTLPPPIGYIPISVKSSGDFAEMTSQFCYQNRDKICYFWLWNKPILVINDPVLVEQVLRDPELIEKDPMYNVLQPWLRNGLVTSSGEKWHHRRRLVTPAFHFSILKSYFITIAEQTSILLDVIEESSAKGAPIDVEPILVRFTLDVICEAAMGVSPNSQRGFQGNEYLNAVETLISLTIPRLIRPYFWFSPIYSLTKDGRRFQNAIKVIEGFTAKTIAARQAGQTFTKHEKKLPFLDLLLTKLEEDKSIIDIPGIQEEVNTFMFAGHHTNYVAITWALQCIGEDLLVQQKIHNELDSVFGDEETLVDSSSNKRSLRPIKFEDLSKLNYLERVFREVLRLYPPAPGFVRRLAADKVLRVQGENVVIPEGASLLISPLVLHKDPKIYVNPDRFDPDRFESRNTYHPYSFIPFSAGPRNCIGQKFALMEAKITLAEILKRFQVNAMNSTKSIGIKPDVVTQPLNPVILKFTLRQ